MNLRILILATSFVATLSCTSNRSAIESNSELEITTTKDSAASAKLFAQKILGNHLRVQNHERHPSRYLDVQMIFETDDLLSYTSYSDNRLKDNSKIKDYNGYLLFVANYEDAMSAAHAFQELKTNTQVRISSLQGYSGLLVEQVQVFERIREKGGLITHKDNYVFYLLESCDKPPLGDNWTEYENIFLRYIFTNGRVEVINSDCGQDSFLVQEIRIH